MNLDMFYTKSFLNRYFNVPVLSQSCNNAFFDRTTTSTANRYAHFIVTTKAIQFSFNFSRVWRQFNAKEYSFYFYFLFLFFLSSGRNVFFHFLFHFFISIFIFCFCFIFSFLFFFFVFMFHCFHFCFPYPQCLQLKWYG